MFNKLNIMFIILDRGPNIVDGKATVDHEPRILCGYCAPHCQRLAIRLV